MKQVTWGRPCSVAGMSTESELAPEQEAGQVVSKLKQLV